MNKPASYDFRFTSLANALVLIVPVYALALWLFDADRYYLIIQEDELVEWATFWAFAAAAYVYLRTALTAAWHWPRNWFVFGLAAFCAFVALEEISWGQRLLGYRPPTYFLAFNYQQELNLHNVVDTDLRKLAVRVIIFGYGVVLPLALRIPALSVLARRAAIVSPPSGLAPAFLLTGVLQIIYPLRFTGEWVELMLGLCFLFAALALRRGSHDPRLSLHMQCGTAWIAIIAIGIISAGAMQFGRATNPGFEQAARTELEALKHDIAAAPPIRGCGLHKRLYTVTTEYDRPQLLAGEFAGLIPLGLPEPRAAFLLDPWNTAYWMRDNCADEAHPHTVFLYSFGPNRRRDSTRWQTGGDDIAVVVSGGPLTPPKHTK